MLPLAPHLAPGPPPATRPTYPAANVHLALESRTQSPDMGAAQYTQGEDDYRRKNDHMTVVTCLPFRHSRQQNVMCTWGDRGGVHTLLSRNWNTDMTTSAGQCASTSRLPGERMLNCNWKAKSVPSVARPSLHRSCQGGSGLSTRHMSSAPATTGAFELTKITGRATTQEQTGVDCEHCQWQGPRYCPQLICLNLPSTGHSQIDLCACALWEHNGDMREWVRSG